MAKKQKNTEPDHNPRLEMVRVEESDGGYAVYAKETNRHLGTIGNLDHLELFIGVLSEDAFTQ